MIIAVLGPTASHKSDLAENLANYFNAEVINFDAYQVYKELNKGTAKPSKEFLNSHNNYHLYDFCSIKKPYDVFNFQKDGRELLNKFLNRNVILVGGTGFYLKALLYDFNFLDEEKMPDDYLINISNDELYERLLKIDPIDAIKITKNNRKRLIRALYIYEIHKKSKTELNNDGKNKLLYDDVKFIGINPPRELLYENINKRVDLMINDGLIDEINEIKKEFKVPNQALQAIGYKEFYLNLPIEETIELIKKNTRHYAKRQLTYFKHQFDDVKWYSDSEEAFNGTI